MLETAPHEHNYLIDHLDEIEAVIVDLSFNVQDDRWLVYCTACGHEHLDLPGDRRTHQHRRAGPVPPGRLSFPSA